MKYLATAAILLGAVARYASAQGDLFREPITPEKYHHEEYERLGYSPAYCPGALPSFDSKGQPYMIVNYPFSRGEPPQTTVPGRFGQMAFLKDSEWRFADLREILRDHFGDKGIRGGGSKQPEFVHDTDELFLLTQYQRSSGRYALALIISPDHGESFNVHTIEDDNKKPYNRVATEHFAGHNVIDWPLVIVMSRAGECTRRALLRLSR